MSGAQIFPDFGVATPSSTVTVSVVAFEEEKLASYETGYQAGWDDSAASNQDAGKQISADFMQNMRDLSMTYHEAYGAVLKDLKPLMLQIVDAVLPEVARETLAMRVVDLIESQMQPGDMPVCLSAAPGDCARLANIAQAFDSGLEIELNADDTLADGQVRLQFGSRQEHELDTQALITGIQTAVHGFFHVQELDSKETA